MLLLTYQWLGFVLGRFPFTRAWGEQLNAFLAATTIDMLTAIAAGDPGAPRRRRDHRHRARRSRAAAELLRRRPGAPHRRGWLDADSARPTRRLATVAVWVFALAMAYPYIPGSGTEAFKGVSVLLGLMVSIGASGIVGQAASGLILMYTRTFRPGEYVRIGEHEGTIVEMGMFTTRVRTGPRRGAHGAELATRCPAVSKNYSRTVKGVGFIARHDGDDRLRRAVAAGRRRC